MIVLLPLVPPKYLFSGLLDTNISLETDIFLVTPDQMWLMIKKTCELWSTGGLQESCFLQDAKFMIFWHFAHDSDFNLFFFGEQKMLNKGWIFFWRSSTTPTKNFGSWLTPPLHNLALSPHRSWFFKNSICQFSTFKSYLGI